uniref:Large ribosomal subunit protein bL9m n=1 Tax=Sphenodon punctatus TaxID=8508 RepID=A0A8D0G7V7_SPHPU
NGGAQSDAWQGKGSQLNPETVIVERWWKVPLSKEGEAPRAKHRRFRVFRKLVDTKHLPKEEMEVILTQSVENIGSRGDVVSVTKSVGRNKLLANGLAVYASPENRQMFEEETTLRREGKLEKLQTQSGEKSLPFILLDLQMKRWSNWCISTPLQLRVMAPPHTLKLPDEPITQRGEYWCEVTVNGMDTVRVPMSVVNFMKPKTKRYKHWLAQQEAQAGLKQ